MEWLRALRAAGTSSIYVSHRMDEVFTMADRITVLRDGRTVKTLSTSETTPREVVALMVGRDLAPRLAPPPGRLPGSGEGESALHVDGLRVRLPRHARAEGLALDGVSLQVRRGEIVAVCGAMGAGRTALLSTLFGCAEGDVTGAVRLGGEPLDLRSPAAAIAAGVAYLPEDRKEKGLVLDLSVEDNLALPILAHQDVMGSWARFGLVDDAASGLLATRRIRELGIRAEARSTVSTLSGGNQQKVALGKWLERPPRLLLLDEPTRGVDIGAREEIYGIIERLLDAGTAVLMASSDLTEVLRLAHRILVLKRGRLVAELAAEDASLEAIVRLTTGAVSKD
jgi:ABC-type sugar transport system ATPase subunit